MYLDAILREAQNSNGEVHGKSLDPHLIDRFSDEQLYQLYELKLATSDVFDPEKAQSKPPAPGNSGDTP